METGATTRADEQQVTAWALAARDGDQHAAAAFVRATQGQLVRMLAHLSDVRSADDLAQETYLRAFRNLHTFATQSTARTWLLAIARRVAADHLRTAARRPRTAPAGDWLDTERAGSHPPTRPGPEEGVVLRELLGQLDPDRREAFVLTQVVGLSYAEAAGVADCPVGTIRSRVARAREDLVRMVYAADTGVASG